MYLFEKINGRGIKIMAGDTNITIKADEKGLTVNVSDLSDDVKKLIVDHLGVDAAKVTDNASFIDDLGADSLDTVELVMEFEEKFGCTIPDDAAEKLKTVRDAISYIEANRKH